MTEKYVHDSNHVKMITVYASSSAALKASFYDAARRTGEVLAAIANSHVWDSDALQFANVTPANA